MENCLTLFPVMIDPKLSAFSLDNGINLIHRLRRLVGAYVHVRNSSTAEIIPEMNHVTTEHYWYTIFQAYEERLMARRMVCSGHRKGQQVIELKPSTWAILGQERWERVESQLTKTHRIFLPALGDASWALYIAGSTLHTQVAISYRCFECAASGIEVPSQPSVICGYGDLASSRQDLLESSDGDGDCD